jgi:signal peptidase II
MIQLVSRKAWVFWSLFLVVFFTDCTTKEAAVDGLSPPGMPHDILGDVIRLTLTYNHGAAMGLPIGGVTTTVLGLLSIIGALAVLFWYSRIPQGEKLIAAALALVFAGALGNGWERLLLTRGVVDFIDVGWGTHRFYTFNVADIGITVGAALLTVLIWLEGRNTPKASQGEGAC